MNINIILKPVKIVKFQDVKIHLEGTTPTIETELDQIRDRKAASIEKKEENGRLYIIKLIRYSIKKVENLQINGKDFDVKFTSDDKKEITEESYDTLLRALDQMQHTENNGVNIVDEIMDLYFKNKIQDESLFLVDDEKKNS